jgi:hypothetical protein
LEAPKLSSTALTLLSREGKPKKNSVAKPVIDTRARVCYFFLVSNQDVIETLRASHGMVKPLFGARIKPVVSTLCDKETFAV